MYLPCVKEARANNLPASNLLRADAFLENFNPLGSRGVHVQIQWFNGTSVRLALSIGISEVFLAMAGSYPNYMSRGRQIFIFLSRNARRS